MTFMMCFEHSIENGIFYFQGFNVSLLSLYTLLPPYYVS